MAKQLITIDKAGLMSCLRTKAGKGLDLRRFGQVECHRSSNIEMDERQQAFGITILHYAMKDRAQKLTKAVWELSGADVPVGLTKPMDETGHKETLLFTEYEDAVTCEVSVIQALRATFGAGSIL